MKYPRKRFSFKFHSVLVIQNSNKDHLVTNNFYSKRPAWNTFKKMEEYKKENKENYALQFYDPNTFSEVSAKK